MGRSVGQYHFEGWDLPTKYGWMHSGPGVRAATQMQDLVNRMGERMIASGELVGRLLGGAQWAGAAATAAGEAMQRGAGQLTQTAAEAATAQRCVTELGESFQAAQHRVPSPNEVPSGLGDKFLFNAAEGFNSLSPFDVQSPLHEAMEQRRELDQQANLALTEHMTTSRERIEAIPAVTAPAPIALAGQPTGVSVGGVGQPAGAAPVGGGFGGNPATITAAGWTGAPGAPPVSPGPPLSAPSGSPSPGPLSLTSALYRPRPTAFQSTGTSPGSPAFGPGSGGRHGPDRRGGAGSTGARGRAALGIGPGEGLPGRDAPGREGPISGPATPGPRGGGRGASGGAGSFMQPPLGGRGGGAEDTEHRDRYAEQADHIVGELPLVAPAVIGETPEEQHRRLNRDGR